MDLSAAIAMYLRHHQALGSAPKTLIWHRSSLTLFREHLGAAIGPIDLRADDLRSFIVDQQGKKMSQATVQTRARSIKAFGRWLAEEEVVPKDPFARVRRPKADDKAQETLSPPEIALLLASIDGDGLVERRDRAIITLLYSTGLRAGELLALQTDDIDFRQGIIIVRKGKGGRFRVVPIGRRAEKAINRYMYVREAAVRVMDEEGAYLFQCLGGGKLGQEGLASMLRRRGQRVGLHVNPHKLRHSAAVQYLRNGGRVEALKSILGHSTIDLTLHYARIAAGDLVTAHVRYDPANAL